MKPDREEGLEPQLDFEKRGGLLIAIAQDADDKEILMVGYVNREALDKTIESGLATFWSTSRHELWTKGLTSGDTLEVQEIWVDCDQDALIYTVKRAGGGACHTRGADGRHRKSCFYRRLVGGRLVFKPES